jgi:hypothetical protein
MHRLRDVLDLLLAEIGEDDGQLGCDLVAHRARNADPAGLGERFKPRRDVDAIAKQIIALDENIADMHADAEAHLFAGRPVFPVFGERLLNRHRALDGVDRTGEIGDDAVAGAAKNPSAICRDVPVESGATGGQPAQGADFVLPHEPTVTFDIGREDRRELADGLFFLAHDADKAEPFAVRCADEALLLPAVADRAARRIDPRAQCRFRDDSSLPNGSKQIVLADDALAGADQVLKEVENLRL